MGTRSRGKYKLTSSKQLTKKDKDGLQTMQIIPMAFRVKGAFGKIKIHGENKVKNTVIKLNPLGVGSTNPL